MSEKKPLKTIDHDMQAIVDWVWREDEYGLSGPKPLAVSELYLTMAEDYRGSASFCIWMAALGAKIDPREFPYTCTLVVSTMGCLLMGDWKDDEYNNVPAAERAVDTDKSMFAFHYRPGVDVHNKLHKAYERPQWSIVMSCDGKTVYRAEFDKDLKDVGWKNNEELLKRYVEALRVLKLVGVETPLIDEIQKNISELSYKLKTAGGVAKDE